VQSPGHQLLAAAALAGDEHGGLGGRDHGDHLDQLAHGRAGADDLWRGESGRQILEQLAVLLFKAGVVQGPGQGHAQHVEIQGLGQVVVGPGLERLHRVAHRGVRGHDEHGRSRVVLLDALERLDAAHLRHAHVHEHGVVGPGQHLVHGLGAVRRRLDVVPPAPGEDGQSLQVGRVVVHYEYLGLHVSTPWASPSGRRSVTVVPWPGALAADISPAWPWTMLWVMARPRPVPWGRVVK